MTAAARTANPFEGLTPRGSVIEAAAILEHAAFEALRVLEHWAELPADMDEYMATASAAVQTAMESLSNAASDMRRYEDSFHTTTQEGRST